MAQENKTERATPYRRRKLKEEGNVAKSHEIAPIPWGLHSKGDCLGFFGFNGLRSRRD